MKALIQKLIQKLVIWLDPKLQPFRPAKPKPLPYTPSSLQELISLLSRTPKTILSSNEREIIATAISFRTQSVSSLMLPYQDITFVHSDDLLGPLMLDRLYRSGFTHFPVLDQNAKIIGTLPTAALNSLKIKDTDRAAKYLDKKVYYLRSDYSLEQAMAAFLRTNCHFFLVLNPSGQTVGLLTYQMLVSHLLGATPEDDFDDDQNRSAVLARKL